MRIEFSHLFPLSLLSFTSLDEKSIQHTVLPSLTFSLFFISLTLPAAAVTHNPSEPEREVKEVTVLL